MPIIFIILIVAPFKKKITTRGNSTMPIIKKKLLLSLELLFQIFLLLSTPPFILTGIIRI